MSDHQRPQSKLDDGGLYQGEREEKLAVAVFRLVREREKHSVPSNLPVTKLRQ